MKKIRLGIVGYGLLGKGAESAIKKNSDTELVAIFTRRDTGSIKNNTDGVKVVNMNELTSYKDKIDVMILCGGSATDLPVQGPEVASMFNTVDSFDTHAIIGEYSAAMDEVLQKSKKVGIVSIGWDPGVFSITRLISGAILPVGHDYTFWGKGLSQGHSDAIRRVDGVKKAVQYTVPIESAIDRVRKGENPELSTADKHLRECYVVIKEGADKEVIERTIKEMPNYFAPYKTTVHFISEEEFDKNHNSVAHGGFVIRSGSTGNNNKSKHIIEYSLRLDSNPEFTSSVLICYARAAFKLAEKGDYGVKTIFDVPPILLSSKDRSTLIKELL